MRNKLIAYIKERIKEEQERLKQYKKVDEEGVLISEGEIYAYAKVLLFIDNYDPNDDEEHDEDFYGGEEDD